MRGGQYRVKTTSKQPGRSGYNNNSFVLYNIAGSDSWLVDPRNKSVIQKTGTRPQPARNTGALGFGIGRGPSNTRNTNRSRHNLNKGRKNELNVVNGWGRSQGVTMAAGYSDANRLNRLARQMLEYAGTGLQPGY